jgi:hypothetical protein
MTQMLMAKILHNEEGEQGDAVFNASDLPLVSARFNPCQGHRLS